MVRVPLYPSHGQSAVRRIANYASFALSAAVLGPIFTSKADVIYVYHPPATVAFPAIVLRAIKRMPYVYDIEDMWPDSLRATGVLRSRLLLSLIGVWCRLAYLGAARVVATSPGFVPVLVSRGVPPNKIAVIPNWCDEAQIRPDDHSEPELRRSLGFEGRFNVVFSGNMGRAQALDAVLAAAALAARRVPKVQFVFIGGGIEVERLKETARNSGLTNVLFLPRRPFSQIGQVLAQADVLLVHLRDDPLFRVTTPSKVQAYLFMGKPILAAVRGDAADLVLAAGAGIACEPESPEGICDAVDRLYRTPPDELRIMGERGRIFYLRELSLSVGTSRFEALFKTIAPVAAMSARDHDRQGIATTRSGSTIGSGAEDWYRRRGKRILDIALVLPGLVLFSPIILALSAAVRVVEGSPVLFRQARPGFRGTLFTLLKFRTMTDARDSSGCLLPDSVRLTTFGRFLRAMSLDELPALMNVLRGEMSLVGPRPLLAKYLPIYTPEQFRRHDMLPGITGWAQVNGRNALSWDDKFRMDVWYVDHATFVIDMKILFKTIYLVLTRKGVSAAGHATMPEFRD